MKLVHPNAKPYKVTLHWPASACIVLFMLRRATLEATSVSLAQKLSENGKLPVKDWVLSGSAAKITASVCVAETAPPGTEKYANQGNLLSCV